MNSTEPGGRYLVSARWADVPKHLHVAGALPEHCSKCGAKVMLSPSSARVLRDAPHLDLKVVCNVCVSLESLLDEGGVAIAVAPGSVEEVAELNRRTAARN
jgi:hypothetical protein